MNPRFISRRGFLNSTAGRGAVQPIVLGPGAGLGQGRWLIRAWSASLADGLGSVGPFDHPYCCVRPISVAKAAGSLSKPRIMARISQAPDSSRTNSATVAAVEPATAPKSSENSSR